MSNSKPAITKPESSPDQRNPVPGEWRASCETCRFRGEPQRGPIVTKQNMILCRRFPPFSQGIISRSGEVASMTVWAVVSGKDWCGEYVYVEEA